MEGVREYEVNENKEFLIGGFNYEGELGGRIEISKEGFSI
ncbi:DUF1806 family protein [Staphylococcus epidermidis]|nr:DUF1806 family protein [Staphylococcus epidermidis]